MKYILIVSFLLLSCEPEMDSQEASPIEIDSKAIHVKTMTLEKTNLDDYFEITGQLRGYKEIDLISNVSGKVDNFRENGTNVTKGTPVFEIDAELYKKQMFSAKSRVDALQKSAIKQSEDLEKYKSLLESKDISPDEYKNHELTALNAVQNANAAIVAYEQARINYENASFIAPFNGVIGQIDLTVGQHVSPGMKIGKLADLNRLKTVVHLSINEALRFKKGNRAIFSNQSIQIEGLIESISPIADSQTGTYLTKIVFNNPKDMRIISGMYGTIKIIGKRYDNIFVIHSDVILNQDGKKFVFLTKDNMTEKKEISPLLEVGHLVVVGNELTEGDQIILSSVGRLDNNIPIRVIE